MATQVPEWPSPSPFGLSLSKPLPPAARNRSSRTERMMAAQVLEWPSPSPFGLSLSKPFYLAHSTRRERTDRKAPIALNLSRKRKGQVAPQHPPCLPLSVRAEPVEAPPARGPQPVQSNVTDDGHASPGMASPLPVRAELVEALLPRPFDKPSAHGPQSPHRTEPVAKAEGQVAPQHPPCLSVSVRAEPVEAPPPHRHSNPFTDNARPQTRSC